jgi:hypothetical protein
LSSWRFRLATRRVASAVAFMTVVVWLVAFPSQSLAAGCRSFETSSSGHPSRVGAIQIRGTDCKTASSLIRDFDAAVARSGGPVGSHLYVDDWRCVVLRPYLPTQFTSATDGECLRAKERVDWIDTEQIPTPSIRFYSLFGVLEGLKRLPATIVIGADGNGAITGLIRWQGWGDASARATGTLHQNNCVPSCAQGLIRKSPVTVTLYERGVYHSHIVYDCLSVSASAPSFDRRFCLPTHTDPPAPRQPTGAPGHTPSTASPP